MKKIYVLNIFVKWDTLPEYKCLPDLPTSFYEYEVEAKDENELYETLADKLSDEYGFCIESLEYEILTIEVKMTREMKTRYINDYEDKEFRRIFRENINYIWRLSYKPDTKEGEFDVSLIFVDKDGKFISEEDQLTKEYAEQIIGGSF